MNTFRKSFFRYLSVLGPVAIVAGIVGWITSDALWGPTFSFFMGTYFTFLVVFFYRKKAHL